ncbi:hypothetical protein NRF20_43765 [Streptomyces sp. R-74717]|uniref:hypothetical protein n=1 Tax=Streptomyces TaxID=1883 RepID=UPI003796664F
MNPQTHLAIDGYIDAIPAPGTTWGTATFDLIHSPADACRRTDMNVLGEVQVGERALSLIATARPKAPLTPQCTIPGRRPGRGRRGRG